jgi:hypothetical protein
MSAEQLAVKRFEMTSLFFEKHSETFTELDAPTWLTCPYCDGSGLA